MKHRQEKLDNAKTVNELILQNKLFQHQIRGITDNRLNKFQIPTFQSNFVDLSFTGGHNDGLIG